MNASPVLKHDSISMENHVFIFVHFDHDHTKLEKKKSAVAKSTSGKQPLKMLKRKFFKRLFSAVVQV